MCQKPDTILQLVQFVVPLTLVYMGYPREPWRGRELALLFLVGNSPSPKTAARTMKPSCAALVSCLFLLLATLAAGAGAASSSSPPSSSLGKHPAELVLLGRKGRELGQLSSSSGDRYYQHQSKQTQQPEVSSYFIHRPSIHPSIHHQAREAVRVSLFQSPLDWHLEQCADTEKLTQYIILPYMACRKLRLRRWSSPRRRRRRRRRQRCGGQRARARTPSLGWSTARTTAAWPCMLALRRRRSRSTGTQDRRTFFFSFPGCVRQSMPDCQPCPRVVDLLCSFYRRIVQAPHRCRPSL